MTKEVSSNNFLEGKGAPSRVLLVFGVRFRDRPSRSAPCISPPSVSPPSPVCAPVPVAAWLLLPPRWFSLPTNTFRTSRASKKADLRKQ
ncbi:UNVERIFIED_CONTAM: hypothetical protein FKN15_003787 [Acipenser sinensis]